MCGHAHAEPIADEQRITNSIINLVINFADSLSLTIPREELDNPHKSKTWTCYRDGFSVTLKFDHYVVLDTNSQ